MAKETLSERLVKYLRKHGGWVASGEMQRIVMQHTTYTPQTTGRELRLLHEEGVLEVQYREKNHAYYRYLPEDRRGYPPTMDGMEQWFKDLPAVAVDAKVPAYKPQVTNNAAKYGFKK